MLKILTFFPFAGKATGGDRTFIETIKRWSTFGHIITIITTNEGYIILKQNGVHFIPYVFNGPRFQSGWREFLGSHLREILQYLQIPKEKFDFIYCPSEVIAYVVPAFAAKLKLKIPLIIECKALGEHEKNFFSSLKYLIINENRPFLRPFSISSDIAIRNFLMKKADLVLVLSNYDKTLLNKIGIPKEKIKKILCGSNFDRIKSVQTFSKFYDGCFVGRIVPQKGLWDLIAAWKIVVNSMPSSKLAIIGDGPLAVCNKLDSLIVNLGLDENIIRFGWLEDDKYDIMKQSKLFIYPSYSETFCISICEAMACKLPVIAYDLPQFNEYYRKGIILVEKKDVKKLSMNIKILLADANMQEKLGMAAFEQAKEYTWDKAVEAKLCSILESIHLQSCTKGCI